MDMSEYAGGCDGLTARLARTSAWSYNAVSRRSVVLF